MKTQEKLYESLSEWIDRVINGESDEDDNLFREYAKAKTKEILGENAQNPIQIKGDDVLVNNKKVGTVTSDPEDWDSGITFTTEDGSYSREFNTIEELYSFIGERFNVKEGEKRDAVDWSDVKEAGKKTAKQVHGKVNQKKLDGIIDNAKKHKPDSTAAAIELVQDMLRGKSVNEGRVEDAVSKQGKMRSQRMKRWKDARNRKQGDLPMGDYDTNDEDEYDDPIKGDADEAAYSQDKDERLDKGYYDSHDPRSDHDDPIKGSSTKKPYKHGKSDRHKTGYYDKHDPRPAQKDKIRG